MHELKLRLKSKNFGEDDEHIKLVDIKLNAIYNETCITIYTLNT